MDSIAKTMRTPRFLGGGRIEFVDKPVPQPGEGQLLLELKANALCGSERHQFFDGTDVTPGHEAAGIVSAAGPNTTTKPGTRGVVFLMAFCGECRSCRMGGTNQCLNKRGDMGFNRDGGYGKYMVVNENIFFPVGDEIPLTEATMLLDIMGTGGHAIRRAQLIRSDIESLLVTGAGPIGLGVLAMAKLMLGKELPVFITDVVPYRLELAQKLGGIPINLKSGTLREGLGKYGWTAVDVAIDTSGKTAARQSGLEMVSHRGVLVCVGHGEEIKIAVSRELIEPERAVLGSEYFCYHELPENLNLLGGNLPYLSQIITHKYPVERIQEAFELFYTGNTGKVIIDQ